jgi:hypothetical protein
MMTALGMVRRFETLAERMSALSFRIGVAYQSCANRKTSSPLNGLAVNLRPSTCAIPRSLPRS